MTLIDRTFKDAAWYWAPDGGPGANGVARYQPAVLLAPPSGGRWDDNPATTETPTGQVVALNARYTTRQLLVNGGWLMKATDAVNGRDPSEFAPTTFAKAREIYEVGTFKSLRRDVTYYQALLK